MGNKKRIGGLTRRRVGQLALKLAINNLDNLIKDFAKGEGISLQYDRQVADQIERELIAIRVGLFRQLYKATIRVGLLKKLPDFDSKWKWNRKKIDMASFPETTKVLQRIVNRGI